MTDFEKMVEMFDRAGITYYVKEDKSEIDCGIGEGAEFYFDSNGNLIGGA
jgi:hypothetical protein